jgi:hypothetical protein
MFKLLFVAVVVDLSCSSNLIYYKDKSYYSADKEQKKLVVFPVTKVKFDDTAKAYTQYFLKKDPCSLEDTILRHLNHEYGKMALQYNKKRNISPLDTFFRIDRSMNDSSEYIQNQLFDKDKSRHIEIMVPKRQIVDSLGIRCNYSLCITGMMITQSRYNVPIIIPLPGGFIAGNVSGPSFLIKCNYTMWDYDKDRTICGGEFCYPVSIEAVCSNKVDFAHDLIAKVLDKTSFWSIISKEEDDRIKEDLQRQGYR